MLTIGRKASATGFGRSSRMGRWALAAAAALTSASMLGEAVFAAPHGGKVVAGVGSIQTQGNATTIRASNGAVIQYRSFDLTNGETVRFIQPGTTSVVLNRIVGGTPTSTMIDGAITANGRVYFVNPSGVMFGPHAIINVSSLYAAAGNISNADFKAGRNLFTIGTGNVVNQGTIQAADGGQVHLLGRSVLNAGTIVAPHGVVTMTSASGDVLISEVGGNITVKVSNPAAADAPGSTPDINAGPAGIQNSGTIQANGGTVKMLGAGDIYSLAVKNAGVVRAADVSIDGGNRAAVVAGRIDANSQATGQAGGDVTITGDRVVINGATIDASGTGGGGNVKIGGDFHGGGTVAQARRTGIMPGSTIKADATGNVADAGSVAVWSTDYTYFDGRISATSIGGKGGFVEVSSHNQLAFVGNVDLTSPRTKPGTLLLDPDTLTISAVDPANYNGGSPGVDLDAAGAPSDPHHILAADGGAGTSGFITPAKLVQQLNTGDVILEASSAITVKSVVDASGNAGVFSLTLTAPTINLNASITANKNLTFDGAVKIGSGLAISLTNPGGLAWFKNTVNGTAGATTESLAITGSAQFDNLVGGVKPLGGLSAGATTINTTAITTSNANAGTGNQTFGTLTLNGNLALNSGGGAIQIASLSGAGQTLTLPAGIGAGSVTVSGTTTLGTLTTAAAGYNVALNGGGTVTTATSFLNTGTLTLGSHPADTTTFTGGLTTTAGPSSTSVTGTLATTGTPMVLGPVTLANNATLSGGTITFANTLATGAAATLTAATVNMNGAVSPGGAAIGTIAVNGNLVLAGTTILIMQVDGAGVTADKLAATGTATLNNAILAGTLLDTNSPPPKNSLVDLVTGSAVAGTFLTISPTTIDGRTFGIVYNAASVQLQKLSTLRTWTGAGADDNWTTVANWGGQKPDPDDILVFGAALRQTNSNDFVAGTQFDSISFNATGFSLGGNALKLVSGMSNAAGTNVLRSDMGLTLTGNQTFTAAGGTTLTIHGTIDDSAAATHTLATAGGGIVRFEGAIGTGARLLSLTTSATGSTVLKGGIVNADTQTYNNPVTLEANASLATRAGGKVWFKNTVDSDAGNHWTLAVDTSNAAGAAGDIQFGNGGAHYVGAVNSLASLTTTATGNTSPANDGKTIFDVVGASVSVTTTGVQTFNNPVQLQADTSLATTAGGKVWFKNTVNSDAGNHWTLAVDTSNAAGAAGDIQFGSGGAHYVGAVDSLASLTTTATGNATPANDGKTIFDVVGASTSVTTTGVQTFNNPVQLQANTSLTGSKVWFKNTVDSDAPLTPRDLTLTANTGTLSLVNAVHAASVDLAGADVVFDAVVGGTNPLKNLVVQVNGGGVGGLVDINNGGLTTTGSQTYQAPVQLTANTNLTTTAGGKVWFKNTVNSDAGNHWTLAVDTSNAAGAAGDIQFGNGGAHYLGAVDSLASLTTTATGNATPANDGKTIFDVVGALASVTTTGVQTYNNPVQLQADTSLTTTAGGKVWFKNTANSDAGNHWTLAVDTSNAAGAAGDIQFGNGGTHYVGAVDSLASLTTTATGNASPANDGMTIFDVVGASTSVTTTGVQTFNNPVQLQANTSLTGSKVWFKNAVDSDAVLTPRDLTLKANTGTLSLANAVHAASVDLAGADVVFDAAVGGTNPLKNLVVQVNGGGVGGLVDINNGGLTTTGSQTYQAPVQLTANTNLTTTAGGKMWFKNTVNSDAGNHWTLAVDTSNAAGAAGDIQFGNGGAHYVGAVDSLTSLTTTATGNATPANDGKTIFDVVGASVSVTTTGVQTFNNPVQLHANTSLTGSKVWFKNTVDSDAVLTPRDLTLTANTGTLSLANAVHAASVDLAGADVVFDAVVGGTNPLKNLVVQVNGGGVGGLVDINNGSLTTTGSQTYRAPVVLTANTTLTTTAGGKVWFQNTLNSDAGNHWTLAVDTSNAAGAAGDIQFGGGGAHYVGAVDSLTSLTTTATGNATPANDGKTIFDVVGASASVTTTGVQTYSNPVQLQANTSLTTTAGGKVWFKNTVNSDAPANHWALAVNTSNAAGAAGDIQLGIGGAQYVGAVDSLGSLSTTATGNATPANDGKTIFDVAGASVSVTTTGAQTYNNPVQLQANASLAATGGGKVWFKNTVNSDAPANHWALAVNTSNAAGAAGDIQFGVGGVQYVGAVNSLGSLTTTATGNATPGNDGKTILDVVGALVTVTTTGAQTYSNPVQLLSDATLVTTSGGKVWFKSTVNSDAPANHWALTVNTSNAAGAAGDIQFGNGGANYVGGVASLASLTTTATGNATPGNDGKTILDVVGALVSVTTTGVQTYNNPVQLQANASLATTAGGKVWFKNTVNSDAPGNHWAFAVNTSNAAGAAGDIQFGVGGAQFVGAVDSLGSLSTTATGNATPGNDGKTIFNVVGASAVVTTTGVQTYANPVQLQAATTLATTAGGKVWFRNTVDSDAPANHWALAVNTSNAAGAAGDIQFGNGGAHYVGAVNSLASLTTTATGNATPANDGKTIFDMVGASASVITTGVQTYNNPVRLQANASLTTTAGGKVWFKNTVNSDAPANHWALAVNTSNAAGAAGDIQFGNGGAHYVGAVDTLASLTTTATGNATPANDGKTIFDVAGASVSVTTMGAQTFNNPVQLQANTSLTGSKIWFKNTVDSDGLLTPRNLTLTANAGTFSPVNAVHAASVDLAGANVVFDAVLGGTNPLKNLVVQVNGGGAGGLVYINNGGLTTTGSQTYEAPVQLTANTTLTTTAGGKVWFKNTVNSDAGNHWTLAVDTSNAAGAAGDIQFGNGGAHYVGAVDSLASLTTTATGNAAPGNDGKTIFDVAGASASVTTIGAQTYNNPVQLLANTIMVTTGAAVGDDIVFSRNVSGPTHNLTLRTVPTAGAGKGITDAFVYFIANHPTGHEANVDVNQLFINSSATDSNQRQKASAFASIRIVGGAAGAPTSYDGTYVIQAQDLLEISRNERLTALGSLDLRARTAHLSDITTLKDLTIYADEVMLKRHQSQTLAVAPGTTGPGDNGASYVIGGVIGVFQFSDVSTGGRSIGARFVAEAGGDALGNLPRLNVQDTAPLVPYAGELQSVSGVGPLLTVPLPPDQLLHLSNVYALEANGPTPPLMPIVVLSPVHIITIASAAASDTTVGELEKLGIIRFKPPTTRPATDLFDDVPQKMANGGGVGYTDFLLTRARIKQDVAERLIALFYQSFPKVDQSGKPIDTFDDMKTELDKAAVAYKKANKLPTTTKTVDSTVKFREFVNSTPGMEKAKMYMDRMRAFFNAIYPVDNPASTAGAGLSIREAEASRRMFVSKLESSGEFEQISAEQVIYAVFDKDAPSKSAKPEKKGQPDTK